MRHDKQPPPEGLGETVHRGRCGINGNMTETWLRNIDLKANTHKHTDIHVYIHNYTYTYHQKIHLKL